MMAAVSVAWCCRVHDTGATQKEGVLVSRACKTAVHEVVRATVVGPIWRTAGLPRACPLRGLVE